MASEVLTIANQKGGVGKTTTAINLAAALALSGQDTLLIDLDPQGNTSSGLGFNKKVEQTIYPVLLEQIQIEKTIRASSIENLDVICANSNLIGSEIELPTQENPESRLKTAIARISNMYKFILIDCPPSLGLLTLNALNASNGIIIPMQCEYYALEGLANFMETIEKVRRSLNSSLEIEGIVFTMFDPRLSLSHQVRTEIEKSFKESFFQTNIPRSIRLAEAPSFGQSIFQYDSKSKGAQAYLALAEELLARRDPTFQRHQTLNALEEEAGVER